MAYLLNGSVWSYTFLSVIIVSAISFIGVFTLSLKKNYLEKILILLVSLSAGVMLGDAFIHLIPEAAESGFTLTTSLLILLGIILFFLLEKAVWWNHCHHAEHHHAHHHAHNHPKKRPQPFAIMNLFGDALHNFIDGILIAGSFIVNIPLGITTTIAVILHEIPQEIGDFGVLLHGGFKKARALLFNFISALFAVIGAVVTLLIGNSITTLPEYLIPFTAGSFIYIAASDLIPQIHHHNTIKSKASRSLLELLVFILGMVIMYGLLFLE